MRNWIDWVVKSILYLIRSIFIIAVVAVLVSIIWF